MKRLLYAGLIYAFPVLCLAALAVAVILFRAPQRATTSQPDELTLLCDIELQRPVNTIVDIFQRRYGIRVETRYENSDRLVNELEQTGRGDLFLTLNTPAVNRAARGGFAIATSVIAQRIPSSDRDVREEPATINAVMLAGAMTSETAPEFIRFLNGTTGREILRRHGYRSLSE